MTRFLCLDEHLKRACRYFTGKLRNSWNPEGYMTRCGKVLSVNGIKTFRGACKDAKATDRQPPVSVCLRGTLDPLLRRKFWPVAMIDTEYSANGRQLCTSSCTDRCADYSERTGTSSCSVSTNNVRPLGDANV